MRLAKCLIGSFVMAWVLVACQLPDFATTPAADEREPALVPVADKTTTDGPEWQRANDCWGKLALLERGLSDGRLIDLEGTPFALIDQAVTPGRPQWSRAAGMVDPVTETSSSRPEARCVIRVDGAHDQQSEHHVLGREKVRSRYQSGTKREKNPAYDVAKARLRQAEKATKPGKSSIIKVGDPLIDLVGTLVGGALTGFGQWGAGDELEEALDTLMATPSSIEHPVYKSYRFERTRMRATREATIPVIMTDRQLQQSWQTSLKRREFRDLDVVTGLDRLDEHYAEHKQNSLTEDGFRQWLGGMPSLPLIDIAAGLLDHPSARPVDRVALARGGEAIGDVDGSISDDSIDAAALPTPDPFGVDYQPPSRSFRGDIAQNSLVKIIGDVTEAEAVFVARNLVLTPSDVVGERTLIDVEDAFGHVALGLVASIDHGLGLALVQSPSSGQPVSIGSGRLQQRQEWTSRPSNKADNAPLFEGGLLVGFRTSSGPNIDHDAISMFLDRQQHLLADQ